MSTSPQLGSQVAEVTLDIDYQIIEHFSRHLYSSPNKAIEELVINGYDAGATWVHVYLPGQHTDKVIVWDNGNSMDIDGIKKLWKLADSPKGETDREIYTRNGIQRKVIGKFGIGKIASYTLGDSITHYCKSAHGCYMVSFDYDSLMDKGANSKILKITINELTQIEMTELVKSCFSDMFIDIDSLLVEETWTFAVIEKLKRNDISQARLRWIIGNALPIQPNFSVYIDRAQVVSKLQKSGINLDWNFDTKQIKEYIDSEWKDAIKEGKVDGEVTYDRQIGLNKDSPQKEISFVKLPNLGEVWGTFRTCWGMIFCAKSQFVAA